MTVIDLNLPVLTFIDEVMDKKSLHFAMDKKAYLIICLLLAKNAYLTRYEYTPGTRPIFHKTENELLKIIFKTLILIFFWCIIV